MFPVLADNSLPQKIDRHKLYEQKTIYTSQAHDVMIPVEDF